MTRRAAGGHSGVQRADPCDNRVALPTLHLHLSEQRAVVVLELGKHCLQLALVDCSLLARRARRSFAWGDLRGRQAPLAILQLRLLFQERVQPCEVLGSARVCEGLSHLNLHILPKLNDRLVVDGGEVVTLSGAYSEAARKLF
eukprot:CAMPEP_0119419660 /NCGR_PEP_ID=MMETSP1335-20130426/21508_1 /TAXON_ID=259385 /ORGANISM="Chrysoculter rhomboideus, Strain RCC1486" /LENGTH=142 /DNA_ID=CAMNT_0007444981 /DNA_START=169 /DNA_END=597 /DNA_ORIENTATION=+